MNKKENINMKNYNSKENKYTDIKSLNILKRAKYCQRLYNKGYSVKFKYNHVGVNFLNSPDIKRIV